MPADTVTLVLSREEATRLRELLKTCYNKGVKSPWWAAFRPTLNTLMGLLP